MQQLGQYVVTLTAAAMICGILLSLFSDGSVRSQLQLICGVFLTVTALAPMTRISLPDLTDFSQSYLWEGKSLAVAGENSAREELLGRIKQSTETYILDKAASMGAAIRPEVELDAEGNPVSVCLQGDCSAIQRQQLRAAITNDLGIPEEDQKWTGET